MIMDIVVKENVLVYAVKFALEYTYAKEEVKKAVKDNWHLVSQTNRKTIKSIIQAQYLYADWEEILGLQN